MLAGVIAGRLGEPRRFRDLAAIGSYSGLVPKTHLSGLGGSQHGLTKAGDPYLREALFLAADQARRIDPQLAARYHRLTTHGNTTPPRFAPSPPPCLPGPPPAGAPGPPTNSATPTAPPSHPNKAEPSYRA